MFLTTETTELFSQKGTARVLRTITSEDAGRIRFRGTDWPARLNHSDSWVSVPPSAKVQVIGRRGLTLLVEPFK
jgi:membrane protein implicated in regulation of membrane protease activity